MVLSLKELLIIFDNQLYIDGIYKFGRWKHKSLQQLKKQIHELELPGFNTWEEKMFAFRSKNFIRPVCKHCNSKVNLKSPDPEIGFYKTCSVKCGAKYIGRKLKIEQTAQEKYGGHWMKTKETQDKFRKIANEKYDGNWPGSFSTAENKKAIKTKYGVDNVFQSKKIQEKIRSTMQDKYGVDNPMQSEEIQNKNKRTCLEKYGVQHPMQDPDIFTKCMRNQQRTAYKFKKFISSSGKEYDVQGYEGQVIRYLLNLGTDENDLTNLRDEMPVVEYEFGGAKRKYFPDVFIKSVNTLIEVKSEYTFSKDFDKNMAKHEAAKRAGFLHSIIIWDDDEKRVLQRID